MWVSQIKMKAKMAQIKFPKIERTEVIISMILKVFNSLVSAYIDNRALSNPLPNIISKFPIFINYKFISKDLKAKLIKSLFLFIEPTFFRTNIISSADQPYF